MPKRLSHLVDLNLLEVFLAIYRHGQLTAAGEELGLSQPGMSRALAKLRDSYRDELFIRTPHGVVATPLADALSGSLHGALEIVRATLVEPEFDPSTQERIFVVAMSDISEQVFLPGLAMRLGLQAPGVRIRTSQLQGRALREAMAAGQVDLALGHLQVGGDGVLRKALFDAQYACIARREHPQIRRSLTLKNFKALGHVIAAGSMTAHAEVIERIMSGPTVGAKVALRVGHFLSMGRIVAQTDLIATIPRSLALTFATAWDVVVHEAPLPLPAYDVCQFWHQRYDRDAGLVWLRSVVEDLYAHESGAAG